MEIDGHNFIPVNAITELHWASVQWDDDTQTATITRLSVDVVVEAGSMEMLIRNNATGQEAIVTLAVPPAMIFGSLAVPIEPIVEALGGRMVWDDATRITILAPRGAELHELVFGDFRILHGEREVMPTGAEGEALQPFKYQGYLFLPAEAILYALGDNVSWDAEAGVFRFEDVGVNEAELAILEAELARVLDEQRILETELARQLEEQRILEAELARQLEEQRIQEAELARQLEEQRIQEIADRIAEARELADGNNFTGAMSILRLLVAQNPNNIDVVVAITSIENSHIDSIVEQANEHAFAQRFEDAVRVLGEGLGLYPDNAALIEARIIVTEALNEAQTREIDLILAQAEIYANDRRFAEAIALLEGSQHSNNSAVIARINEYTARLPRPLNVAAPFFDSGRTGGGYSSGSAFVPRTEAHSSAQLSGVMYDDVIVFTAGRRNGSARDSQHGVFSLHNLNGQFKLLEGYVGRVDNTNMMNAVLEIRGDGNLLQSYDLNATAMPTHISVLVESVQQLRIDLIFPHVVSAGNQQASYAISLFVE